MEGTVRMSNRVQRYAAQDQGCRDSYHTNSDWPIVRWDDPLLKLESRATFRQSQRANCPKRGIFQILQ